MIRASSGKTPAGRLLLSAGALAVLGLAIAGCEAGNNAPTLEFHPAAAGAQTVFNGITISDAFVLGAPSGSLPSGGSAGLFASIYNGGASADTLESVSSSGTAASVSLSGGPVALPADSAPADLTGPTPQIVLEKLTKSLTGGTTVPVTFDFAHAGSVTLQVPVEAQAFYWSTYSAPASPSATSSAGAAHSSATATPVVTPATPSTTASASASATP